MSYATTAQVKSYLGLTGTSDDTLIGDKINAATSNIETYTDRKFQVQSNSTRYFDSCEDVDGLTLFLDHDICHINSITNGDGTAVTSAQYATNPRNGTPYYAIKLKSSYSLSWEDDDNGDNEDAIQVSGKWGYSEAPPKDIVEACVQWAALLYKNKDSQVFDVTATPELGQLTIPKGMPASTRIALRRYQRA